MSKQPVTCPTCGNVIGEEVTDGGMTLIHAGGGVWRELRGWCAQCGGTFFWSASDRQLSELLGRILGPGLEGVKS